MWRNIKNIQGLEYYESYFESAVNTALSKGTDDKTKIAIFICLLAYNYEKFKIYVDNDDTLIGLINYIGQQYFDTVDIDNYFEYAIKNKFETNCTKEILKIVKS